MARPYACKALDTRVCGYFAAHEQTDEVPMALDGINPNSTLPIQNYLDPGTDNAATHGSSGAADINADQALPGTGGSATFSPTAFSQQNHPVESLASGGAPLNDVAPSTLLAANSGSSGGTTSGNAADSTLLARAPRPGTHDVAVGKNVYNHADNTFNGRKLELVGGDPRQYADIDRVVLHETTDGNLTQDSINKWRFSNESSVSRNDIVVNSDAVVLRDGNTLQGSVGNRRDNDYFGVAGGIGTISENKTRGTNFDIEIDYNAEKEYINDKIPFGIGDKLPQVIERNGVTEVTDAQYRATAKATAEVAILKYTGEVKSGANRDPNNYKPVVTVEPHYFTDRGLDGAHKDPRSFDQAKFQRYVNEELKAYGVPNSLVQFKGW
jgi:hypothetical protein